MKVFNKLKGVGVKNTVYHWLRRSESFFKTDMVYLAKGGFWLALGQAFASLASFILAIAFANLLPKEVYGNYKYIVSIFPMVAIFALNGLGTVTTQSVSRGFEGTIKIAIKTRIKWALFGSLVSFFGSAYYFTQGNIILSYSFVLIGIFVPLFETLGTYDSVLQGKKKFDVSIKYFIASQAFATLCLITTLFLTDNILIILGVYFATWTLARGVFLFNTFRNHIHNENIDPSAISNGMHLSFLGAFGTFANYLDKVFIFTFLGATPLAVYSIATAPVDQLKSLITRGAASLSFPKFANMSRVELRESISQHTKRLTIVSVLLSTIYMVLASPLFKTIFPQYIEAIPYSIGYAFILMPLAYILPASALSASMAKKALYIFNISSSMFQIITLILGMWLFGIWGLILARVISKVFDWIISYSLIRKMV